MKKILITLLLVFAIVGSITVGTLALYQVKLDDLTGDVTAKHFAFSNENVVGFEEEPIKIAPTETAIFKFLITNYEQSGNKKLYSETNMRIDLTVSVYASPNKNSIQPLSGKILDTETGELIADLYLEKGVGAQEFFFHIPFKTNPNGNVVEFKRGFTVEIFWPSTANDADYGKSDFGNRVAVGARATQVGAILPDKENIIKVENLAKFDENTQFEFVGDNLSKITDVQTIFQAYEFYHKYANEVGRLMPKSYKGRTKMTIYSDTLMDANNNMNENNANYSRKIFYRGFMSYLMTGSLSPIAFSELEAQYAARSPFSDFMFFYDLSEKKPKGALGGIYFKYGNNSEQVMMFADGTIIYGEHYGAYTTYLQLGEYPN